MRRALKRLALLAVVETVIFAVRLVKTYRQIMANAGDED